MSSGNGCNYGCVCGCVFVYALLILLAVFGCISYHTLMVISILFTMSVGLIFVMVLVWRIIFRVGLTLYARLERKKKSSLTFV